VAEVTEPTAQTPLLPWVLSFLTPHRGRVSLLAGAAAAGLTRGAAAVALAIAIDHVLGSAVFPDAVQVIHRRDDARQPIRVPRRRGHRGHRAQVVNQFVSA
jgi:hypothetical protein